jgi:hypothetical protein
MKKIIGTHNTNTKSMEKPLFRTINTIEQQTMKWGKLKLMIA